MSDLTVTAAQVALVNPSQAKTKVYIANAAITKGQPVYLLTTGKVGVADANDSGKEQVAGISLDSVAAGQPLTVCWEGEMTGFDLSGMDYGDFVMLSDTAGKLATQPGTLLVNVGTVQPMTDSPTLTKVLAVSLLRTNYWGG